MTAGEPLAAYDVVLLDLDGVVYLGDRVVPGAAEAVAEFGRRGHRVGFVTNNASRAAPAVAELLRRLGVPAAPEQVVTAAQAAARLLADRLPPGARVLAAGSPALAGELSAVGLHVVPRAEDGPVAVVNGFSAELTYAELAEAALAIRAGALWVATNLDATLPTPRGEVPGNGSISALLATATGRTPISAGKPAPTLLTEAVRRSQARRALFVGDRLDTDVVGARAAGLASALVFTGVSRPADLLRATPEQRPTYLCADLGGLLRAEPRLHQQPGRACCGGWVARRAGQEVQLTGSGDPVDAVRCAAALAWAVLDQTGRPAQLSGLPA